MGHWSRKTNKPSYFKEMLKHPYNLYAGLSAVSASAITAMASGSVGVGSLPILAYLTGLGLSALYIPGARWWQDKVDEKRKVQQREAAREHLKGEISQRVGFEHQYWGIYDRLLDRLASLKKVALEQDTALTGDDVDRLDNATVDFLGLWLGRIAIFERYQAISERELRDKLGKIEHQLEQTGPENIAERHRLRKAKSDLESLVQRRNEMRSREAAAEAAMLSMADTFDELYQRIMQNPTSRENIEGELDAAVQRMDIEEELDYVLEEEVGALLG